MYYKLRLPNVKRIYEWFFSRPTTFFFLYVVRLDMTVYKQDRTLHLKLLFLDDIKCDIKVCKKLIN